MPPTPLPPTVDEDVVGRLRFAVARLSRLLRQQDESGLTPTQTAMLATVAREGPLTLGDLAASEQVAPPTVTKLVDRLESAGLVARVRDERDRRIFRVQISAKGRRQLEANRSRRNAWLSQRLATLPADDLAKVADAVELLEHLTARPEEGAP